ncbi:MAG: hypothetical protein KatS3mg104_0146 [Phycisphaerae bacterium]|mgnify:CR=1 FL=1|jgi:hypothetical protein|nr:MAG: hypothetical protein KatS3mg104_0146 [Phycisphaerae bacterium]
MFNTPLVKTFLIIVISGLVIAAFFYQVSAPRFGVPDERLRIRHPSGFSAVQPKDWIPTEIQLFDGDLTRQYQLGFFENRSEVIPAEIMITRLPGPPADLDRSLPVRQIAGRDTYRKYEEKRKFTLTTLWFEEGGIWYRVTLRVPYGAVDEDLYPYVATIRTEQPAIPSPTTRPSSQPGPTPSP